MSDLYARYDYAWQQMGWTTQNPGFTIVADPYNNPGLPDDVAKVRLYGKFLDFNTGRPLDGMISIRTSDILTHVTTGSQVIPGVQRTRFRDGEFSLILPATDDETLTPEFLYQCRLTVGGYTQEFQFALHALDEEVNVIDLVPAPTGSIEIFPIEGDGVSLGTVPDELTVHLVDGADFNTVLVADEAWAPGTVVSLLLGEAVVWNATINGLNATFSVDKAVADTVADGTSARLRVTEGTNDEVWAVGRVVRHGGSV